MVDVLEFGAYGEAIGNAGSVVRSNAASAGLRAGVPTCPGWSVADLVTHVGTVHRWATAIVSGAGSRPDAEVRAEAGAASDLLEWFDDGMVGLLNALAQAPADLDVRFFLPDAPAPRLAWARRQAHETTIHGVDAMAARLGRPPTGAEVWMTPSLAADGLDELLTGFAPRRRYALTSDKVVRALVAPTDADRAWLVETSPEGTRATRVAGRRQGADATDADTVVTGTARQLYLALWNRGSEVEESGAPGWLAAWAARVRVSWT